MTLGKKLTHIDADGRARMVDVSAKPATKRIATATGRVVMSREALELARSKGGKGDVRAAAEIAGVMAAKKTSDLIPMCHPLQISNAKVRVDESETAAGTADGGGRSRDRSDRRRDGGADGGVGGVPDDLRHAEGGGPRHADRRRAADREVGRQVGPLSGEGLGNGGPAVGRRRVGWRLKDAKPLSSEPAALLDAAWPGACR